MARRAVEMLATLYQARSHAERERRAHDRVGDARLQWVTRWLLLLLVPAAALLRGELDRFQAVFRAQVLVGGILGLVALLLCEVGSLPTFQAVREFPDLAPVVVDAFLAGFSEPFVLGVVQGLIGARSTPPSPSPQSDRADHPNR